jgi:hypothetical protein
MTITITIPPIGYVYWYVIPTIAMAIYQIGITIENEYNRTHRPSLYDPNYITVSTIALKLFATFTPIVNIVLGTIAYYALFHDFVDFIRGKK